ncbi:MAG: hypothetical protein AAB731_03830, partial [Patescibacteria group bacterium]
MSEALQKIEPFKFIESSKTGYGRALAGQDQEGNALCSNAVCSAFAVSAIMSFLGFCISISGFVATQGFVHITQWPWWVIPLAGGSPWIFFGSAIPLRMPRLKREIKKNLADALLRFEWQVAKAAEIHNLRVRAFDNQLEWRTLGYSATDDETLQSIRGLLVESEELIRRGWRILLATD